MILTELTTALIGSTNRGSVSPRKTGPHNRESLRRIREIVRASLKALDAADESLAGCGRTTTIYPLGARGLAGTATYKGALDVLKDFATDAKQKAEQALKDEQRRKKKPPMV